MYNAFGYAHGGLLVGSAVQFEYLWWDYYWDWPTEIAAAITGMLCLGSMGKLMLYASEWTLRYFGLLGRIANLGNYYTLMYAWVLQIGSAAALAYYVVEAINYNSDIEYGIFALYAAWNAAVFYFQDDVLAYLEILQEEMYLPLIDWSFFSKEDVTEDGMVVIDESNYWEYQIKSRRRSFA